MRKEPHERYYSCSRCRCYLNRSMRRSSTEPLLQHSMHPCSVQMDAQSRWMLSPDGDAPSRWMLSPIGWSVQMYGCSFQMDAHSRRMVSPDGMSVLMAGERERTKNDREMKRKRCFK